MFLKVQKPQVLIYTNHYIGPFCIVFYVISSHSCSYSLSLLSHCCCRSPTSPAVLPAVSPTAEPDSIRIGLQHMDFSAGVPMPSFPVVEIVQFYQQPKPSLTVPQLPTSTATTTSLNTMTYYNM